MGGHGSASPGTCGSGCSHLLLPFMVMLGLTSIVASFSQTPSYMMILRYGKKSKSCCSQPLFDVRPSKQPTITFVSKMRIEDSVAGSSVIKQCDGVGLFRFLALKAHTSILKCSNIKRIQLVLVLCNQSASLWL